MSTKTATRRGVGDRIDDAQEAVSSGIGDFAAAWGKRIGAHLFHVTLFVVIVVNRDHTVLAVARWARKQAGTAVGGMPDTMLGLWAQSFDGIWDALGKLIGL